MLPGDSGAHLCVRPGAPAAAHHAEVASQVVRHLSGPEPAPSSHHQTPASRTAQLYWTELLQHRLKPSGIA